MGPFAAIGPALRGLAIVCYACALPALCRNVRPHTATRETDLLDLTRSSVRPIQDKQAHTIAYTHEGSPAGRAAVRDDELSNPRVIAWPALLEDIGEIKAG